MTPPVDEESRRAGDAAKVSRVDVLGDLGLPRATTDVTDEPLDLEPDVAGVPDQVLGRELTLMAQQLVVHLPELVLKCSGLRCLGRKLRVRVHIIERQMPPHIAEVTGVRQQLASGAPRMWSRCGSTGTARSMIDSAVPSSAASRTRFGSNVVRRKTTQVSAEAHNAADSTPTLASASSVP